MRVVHVHFGCQGQDGSPCTRWVLPLQQPKIAKIKENIMMSLMQWYT
jgi:hypothetical protein